MNRTIGIFLLAGAGVLLFLVFRLKENAWMTDLSGVPSAPRSAMADQVSEPDSIISYLPYTPEAYQANAERKRVLFFHAAWCPYCREADAEFSVNGNKIPDNAVVLKTDYDSETELKRKYGVTSQHTFVQVDAAGNAVVKWNGGAIEALSANLK